MARRHRKPDAAFHFLAEHESQKQIAAAYALQLGDRQQCRRQGRGRMDRSRHVGIAEIEHIGARGIEKRRAERIDALVPADQSRLPAAGECGQRAKRDLEGFVAAAGQGDGEEIQERALGLMRDLIWQIAPSRRGYEIRQALGHAGLLQHCPPSPLYR